MRPSRIDRFAMRFALGGWASLVLVYPLAPIAGGLFSGLLILTAFVASVTAWVGGFRTRGNLRGAAALAMSSLALLLLAFFVLNSIPIEYSES